ncbi:MAG: hypothetical protein V4707_00475 [Pseudomonadota bacterium]
MTVLNSLMSVALIVAPAQAAPSEIGGVWEGSISVEGQSPEVPERRKSALALVGNPEREMSQDDVTALFG